jgi:hypothetical protein
LPEGRHVELVRAFGPNGFFDDVCSRDFGGLMRELGQRLAAAVARP